MFTIKQEDMRYSFALYIINKVREPSGICQVEFKDGIEQLPIQAALLQIPFWEVYKELGYDVYKKHLFFTKGPFNKKIYKKIIQQIYNDVTIDNQEPSYMKRVKEALWICINNIDDFGTMELNEFHCTFSVMDLAEIAEDPLVKKLRETDIDEKNGTVIIKQRLTEANDKLIDYLSNRGTLSNDSLTDFIEIGALKHAQVGQVMLSYGLRTEIDDKVMKRPVYGSSLSGYNDIIDYAIDNQSARKNVYMTHTAIRKSQYMGRKFAILMSILQQLYKNPCDTKTLLPFTFTDINYNKCFGKIFIEKDRPDELIVLTESNYDKYLNKEILMYSPITCTHTTGICSRCFGMLSKNYTEGVNIGIDSASNLTSGISQLILSTKHYDQASPTVYVIPEPANEIFRTGSKGIMFVQNFLKESSNYDIGIFYKDIYGSISDLQQITDELNIPAHRYSSIKNILLRNKKTGVITELPLEGNYIIPHLSLNFLKYMRDHFTEMEQEKDVIWVPIVEEFKDKPIPILNSVIKNNSMLTYVENITNFVEKNHLTKYHNASEALKDFSNMIFEKISDVNIVQIEALLRAHMVTSNSNYSLPIVTDVNKVLFKKTEECISERTIAGQMIFEKHNIHFAKPNTYTRLKEQSIFDVYFDL